MIQIQILSLDRHTNVVGLNQLIHYSSIYIKLSQDWNSEYKVVNKCYKWVSSFKRYCLLTRRTYSTNTITYICHVEHKPITMQQKVRKSHTPTKKTKLVVSEVKTWILNLVRTTRFWNNRHQVLSKPKEWKDK